ncbi:store-operated calcium entry-associated regulatory factor isoform X2 [Parambassis ranga]|uniref:Store-operated calcium entry-associated regulatory factor n=1 Tax=Parambassis ranga TaxID=210632 RepID=A0A6P7ICH7_9TELE|nr:store-operated calcium entry-associated regulatory factor isoform X2 [Parambassis ranga]
MKLLIAVVLLLSVGHIESLNGDSVLLRDIQVLTLYRSRYTTARRSSPIPQLKCVGGSAGCQAFIPDVVQCVNKGWDGVDVQWECRTDMDNAYRFGHIEVSCEGFSHPADAYILKGSCGLEYTMDLTEEGKRRAQGSMGSHSGFGGYPGTNTSYGFHSENYGSYRQAYPGRQDAPSMGGGFWTAMGTGGVLGYLFGRQRSQSYNSDHSGFMNNRHHTTDPSSSSGTRTASGFGGTKRR